jgi:hypothetical protein
VSGVLCVLCCFSMAVEVDGEGRRRGRRRRTPRDDAHSTPADASADEAAVAAAPTPMAARELWLAGASEDDTTSDSGDSGPEDTTVPAHCHDPATHHPAKDTRRRRRRERASSPSPVRVPSHGSTSSATFVQEAEPQGDVEVAGKAARRAARKRDTRDLEDPRRGRSEELASTDTPETPERVRSDRPRDPKTPPARDGPQMSNSEPPIRGSGTRTSNRRVSLQAPTSDSESPSRKERLVQSDKMLRRSKSSADKSGFSKPLFASSEDENDRKPRTKPTKPAGVDVSASPHHRRRLGDKSASQVSLLSRSTEDGLVFVPAVTAPAPGAAKSLSPLDVLRDKRLHSKKSERSSGTGSTNSSPGSSPNPARRTDFLAPEVPVPFHYHTLEGTVTEGLSGGAKQVAIDHELDSLVSLAEAGAPGVRVLATAAVNGMSFDSGALVLSESSWQALAELVSCEDGRAVTESAWALAVLSAHEDTHHDLVRHIGYPRIHALIESSEPRVQLHGATVLSSLALCDDLQEDLLQEFFADVVAAGTSATSLKFLSRLAAFWANVSLSEECALSLQGKEGLAVIFAWLRLSVSRKVPALAHSALNIVANVTMSLTPGLVDILFVRFGLATLLSDVWQWRLSSSDTRVSASELIEIEKVSTIALANCAAEGDAKTFTTILDAAASRLFSLMQSTKDGNTLFFACNVVASVASGEQGRFSGELEARGAMTALRAVIRGNASDMAVAEAERALALLSAARPPPASSTPEKSAKPLKQNPKRRNDHRASAPQLRTQDGTRRSSSKREHKSGSRDIRRMKTASLVDHQTKRSPASPGSPRGKSENAVQQVLDQLDHLVRLHLLFPTSRPVRFSHTFWSRPPI